jgi:hypothetical protein
MAMIARNELALATELGAPSKLCLGGVFLHEVNGFAWTVIVSESRRVGQDRP